MTDLLKHSARDKLTEILANEANCFEASLLRTTAHIIDREVFDV
jgi:hypothetical protein